VSLVGSTLAGAKAGVVASLFFAGSISLFNILLLYSFKNQTLAYLATNYTNCSARGPASVSGTAEYCFSNLIFPGVPLYDLLRGAVIAMLFSVAIGMYYDVLPGATYFWRGLLGAMIMLVAMLFLNIFGLVTSQLQEIIMISFQAVAAILYSLIIARLYRRFTREVQFQTNVPSGKIIVDRRDLTGRKRTFNAGSKHTIEAAGELKSFKGWLVSGGVAVSEPKQVKTTMTINGDGLLKLP
jgi:hypothetical protein